ncbi:MAG: tRNA (adenosine(37)-N6)-threonylcarbamoyltransferase complex transferase subunit TsaD [Thermaerobacter sp.]|nr:tRNA (adenosine(37)-N6)-threonylcarbamoyltransferase complex transferase subunit TsaD [Thermaerobacter sp.]
MICLGIESSCDETAAALVTDEGRVLGSSVASQIDLHEAFGGVVPEVAARRHLERLSPTVLHAFQEAGIAAKDVGLVAVTRGPGLAGALMVGLSFAKAYAFARDLPLVGVNHVVAHAYAAFLGADLCYPELALIASGGHTVLLQLHAAQEVEVLGRSRDDAAGEAFDKVARALGLGYPGGPLIERIARDGDSRRAPLPEVRTFEGSLDFSFSGLKTAAQQRFLAGAQAADIAAAFQESVLSQLLSRTRTALERTGARRLVFAGGVSANGFLRRRLAEELAKSGVELLVPPLRYSTDNAAMIARLGLALYAAGERSPEDLNAEPVIHPFKP